MNEGKGWAAGKIKKCPCGGRPDIVLLHAQPPSSEVRYFCLCDNCDKHGPAEPTEALAVRTWNQELKEPRNVEYKEGSGKTTYH